MVRQEEIRLSHRSVPWCNQPRTQPKFKGPGNQEIGKGMTLVEAKGEQLRQHLVQQVSGIIEVVTTITNARQVRIAHRYMFE